MQSYLTHFLFIIIQSEENFILQLAIFITDIFFINTRIAIYYSTRIIFFKWPSFRKLNRFLFQGEILLNNTYLRTRSSYPYYIFSLIISLLILSF